MVGPTTATASSAVARGPRQCAAAIAAGRADSRLGTATRTGLPGAAFGHVVSVNNVLFWGDIPAGIAELRRVLRPGGSLVVAFHSRTAPSRHERLIGLPAVAALALQALAQPAPAAGERP